MPSRGSSVFVVRCSVCPAMPHKYDHHTSEKPVASCCHEHEHGDGEVKPPAAAKYFCPMCAGVESDKPGTCPKCGMALERNPAWKPATHTIYTCPMHPEIEQDHPGNCPLCGMAL